MKLQMAKQGLFPFSYDKDLKYIIDRKSISIIIRKFVIPYQDYTAKIKQ